VSVYYVILSRCAGLTHGLTHRAPDANQSSQGAANRKKFLSRLCAVIGSPAA
jgi:hypothetical protein